MTLTALQQDIQNLIQSMSGRPISQTQIDFANGLAEAIDTYIKTARVSFDSTVPGEGTITGTCPPGGGPLTLGAASGGKLS